MPSLQALQTLQILRTAHRITRFVLVWFVLSLGAAIASPLVSPQATELICSGTGVMKLLVKNADGTINDGGTAVAEAAQPLGHVLQTIPAAHMLLWRTP